MKFPPWLARVGYGSWTLWLPLVILWPLWLAAFSLILLFGGIAALVIPGESLARFGTFVAGLYRLLCEVRGTRVSVEEAPHRIVVAFY
jgi:hypothetical protein